MNRGERAVCRIRHTVGGQRRTATDARMQIAEIGAEDRVRLRRLGHEEAKHPVVIALQGDPVFPGLRAFAQIGDDLGRVRATVNQIAQMDDGGGGASLMSLIIGNQIMRPEQQVELAVNITDRIAAHGHPLLICA